MPPSRPLHADQLPNFEWMQTPVWVFDVVRLRQYWANEAALALWNSPNLEEFQSRDFSDMSEAAKTRMKAVMQELSLGTVLQEQWTLYPRGTPVTVQVSRVGIFLPDGELASLQQAIPAPDIDPLVLRGVEALHHTNVFITLFSLTGTALMRNPAAVRTFGPIHPDDGNDDFAALFCSDDDLANARSVLRTGSTYSAEIPVRTVHGQQWHGMDVRKVTDPVTGHAAMLVNARDISDRRRAEQATQELLAAEKRFLASMSHEIRTPLNAVVGFIDLLRTTHLSDQQRKYLDNAHVSAQLLRELVSDILDMSKLDAGQVEIATEEFDLEDVLLECVVVASTRISSGVELSYRIPELDSLVVGDSTRVKQIVVNLLGNSAKFTKRGRVILSLALEPPTTPGTVSLAITIEDTGIGIPDDKMDSLFTPFRQAHAPSYGGSGLGLFLSRSFARMMGGEIEMRSKVGEGTTATVRLSLKRGADRITRYSFHGMPVLLLTSDASIRRLVAEGFERAGATMIELPDHNTPTETLRALLTTSLRPRVVIIDVQDYGKIAGPLIALIRHIVDRVVVVALVNSGLATDLEGIDLSFDKPFTFHNLSRTLHELVNSASTLGDTRLRAMRVLLAEDVEANAVLVSEMFRLHFGIALEVARDGEEAIRMAQANAYDLVLMDIQMPGMDGLEATRTLKQRGVRTPIVAMTANALSDQVQAAFDAGMDGYITKPVRRSQLERVVVKYCPRSAQVSTSNPPRISRLPSCGQDVRTTELPPSIRIPPKGDIGREYRDAALRYFISLLGAEQAPMLVETSMRSVAEVLVKLRATLQARDSDGLVRALHSVKGILLNSGLDAPAHTALRIEQAVRAGAGLTEHDVELEDFFEQLSLFSSEDRNSDEPR